MVAAGRSARLVSGAVLALLSVAAVRETALAQDAFFYTNADRVRLNVALDQVGFVAADGAQQHAIENFAAGFELRIAGQYPEGIFVFALPERSSRAEIVKLARTMARDGAGIIDNAGFVAQEPNGSTPFVVTDEFVVKFKDEITTEEVRTDGRRQGVEIVSVDPFVDNQFVLRVTDDSPVDALEMANRYHERPTTLFSHPNFVRVVSLRH